MGYVRDVIELAKETVWPRPPQMISLEDVLMRHADRLIRGERNGNGSISSLVARFPEDQELVRDLLAIAVGLSHVLAPLAPAPSFRARLQNQLVRQPRESEVTLALPGARSLWQERRTEILIGATVGSVLSAGLVFVIRHFLLGRHSAAGVGVTSEQ